VVHEHSSLLVNGSGEQQAKREERADGNVFVVHKALSCQWQRVNDRLGLVNVLGIGQEDGSAAVGTREPLSDHAVEVELHCCANFGRHGGHDLIAGNSGLRSEDDQHPDRRGLLVFGRRRDETWLRLR
jgi:hypothetical protein